MSECATCPYVRGLVKGQYQFAFFSEVVFESVPQIIIQIINQSATSFTPEGIVSLIFTLICIYLHLYKFIYYVVIKRVPLSEVPMGIDASRSINKTEVIGGEVALASKHTAAGDPHHAEPLGGAPTTNMTNMKDEESPIRLDVIPNSRHAGEVGATGGGAVEHHIQTITHRCSLLEQEVFRLRTALESTTSRLDKLEKASSLPPLPSSSSTTPQPEL